MGVTLNTTDLYNGTLRFPVTMRSIPTLVSGASYTNNSGSNGTPGLWNSTGGPSTVDQVLFYNAGAAWTANIRCSLTAGLVAEL
jgi:hypothetical protein